MANRVDERLCVCWRCSDDGTTGGCIVSRSTIYKHRGDKRPRAEGAERGERAAECSGPGIVGDRLDVGDGADVDLFPREGQDDGGRDESEGGREGPRAGPAMGHPGAEGCVEEDGLDEELEGVGPVEDGGWKGAGAGA